MPAVFTRHSGRIRREGSCRSREAWDTQKGIGIEQALLIADLPLDAQRARAESLMGVAKVDAVLALSAESQPLHSYTWSPSAGGRSRKTVGNVVAASSHEEAACSRQAQSAVTIARIKLSKFSKMNDDATRCALTRAGVKGPEAFLKDLQALERMVDTVRAQIERSCRLA